MKAYEAEKRIREKERAEGRAEDIIELLEEVGMIPEELEKRILAQKNLELLRTWLKLASRSRSIEEFEAGISGAANETKERTGNNISE